METESNPAQQLPNTGPKPNGGNNLPNPKWNPMAWGSFGYYNWAMPMMYWENNPETQTKDSKKGGKTLIRTDKPKTRSGGAILR